MKPNGDNITIAEALAFGKSYLSDGEGGGSAGLTGGAAVREARILLSAVMGEQMAFLVAYDDKILSPTQLRLYHIGLKTRAAGKPMALIRGSQEFYGLDFACDNSLIPRPDSEALVELALRCVSSSAAAKEDLRVLDLGCGSGCLGIAFALHCEGEAHVTFADTDERALQSAKANAERHLSPDRFDMRQSHWCADVGGDGFDVILCNPPYIATDDLIYLPRSVRCYEPTVALWGGDSGVAVYEILAQTAGAHLRHGGCLCVEVGAGQAARVADIFTAAGFGYMGDGYDLGGIRRALAFGYAGRRA